MDYTDFMLWKLGAMAFAAFCWGLFFGVTGRPMRPGQNAKETAAPPGSKEGSR